MRQGSIILATALVTAVLTVFAMKVFGFAPVPHKVNAEAGTTVDVMKLMREAKDLPIENYQAY